MLKNVRAVLIAALALIALMLPTDGALAQVAVTQQPVFITPNAVTDLGNGPLELKVLQGTAMVGTSFGTGLGSGTTTSITLTATPTSNPPCVGCLISGAGITGVTVITAYNGTTGITVNTSQTINASTPLAWGSACPASPPPITLALAPLRAPQATDTGDYPFQTEARICAYGNNTAGAQIFTFPIGAH